MSHRWRWAGACGVSVLAVAMLVSPGRAQTLVDPTAASTTASNVAARILAEANHIMAIANTTTHYSHGNYINVATNEYDVDCSGFLDFVLQNVSPQHLKQIPSTHSWTKAADYYNAFAAAPTVPSGGSLWQHIERVADIQPGDFIALKSPGHVMLCSALPKRVGDDLWAIGVIDSTRIHHDEDVRRPTGTGVGTGSCQIRTGPHGQIQAYRPSHTGKWRSDINIGRPENVSVPSPSSSVN